MATLLFVTASLSFVCVCARARVRVFDICHFSISGYKSLCGCNSIFPHTQVWNENASGDGGSNS